MRPLGTVVTLLVILAVGLTLVSSTADAQYKIIFLNNASTKFPGQGDFGWVSLLQSKGYTVTRDTTTMGTRTVPLRQGQIDTLNMADLIILGRTTASGNFSDTVGFNLGITKPLITFSPHVVRSADRLNWWFGSNFDNGGSPKTKVLTPFPLFNGVTLDADSTVQLIDSTVGPCRSTSLFKLGWGRNAGNATVVAMQKDTSGRCIAIAYFPAGQAFATSTGNKAGGKRMFFNAGTYDSNSVYQGGSMNLTAAGQKVFLNAVEFMITGNVTGVKQESPGVVNTFALEQNYPNPFNPTTRFAFQMSKAGHVSIRVYDILGKEVATLVDEFREVGSYPVEWNAAGLASGVYIYKMQTESFTDMKKMILMK